MRKSLAWMTVLAIAICAHRCCAEDLLLFRASERGEGAWAPTGARIKQKLGKLQVGEYSKEGFTGSILLADNLPFFRKGVMELDVFQVMAGSYTLQVLALKGGGHIATVDVVKDETKAGKFTFYLEDLALPRETEEILLKLWVGGVRGASLKLNDLTYTATLDENMFLLDERFAAPGSWKADKLLVQSGERGSALTLAPGAPAGSLLCDRRFARGDFDALLIQVPAAENGYVTAQFVMFDPQGAYLQSVDVLRHAGAGVHVARADQVAWPAGAEHFQIKLWLSGPPGAKATLARGLVLKKPGVAPAVE